MLVDNRRGVWVVTPTKTATMSLEAELKECGFAAVLPRHAVTVSREVPKKIVLPVRNPFARLSSMYKFGVANQHSTLRQWSSDGKADMATFCQHWLAYRAKPGRPDWKWTYSNYLTYLKTAYPDAPVMVVRIERDLPRLFESLGIVPKGKRINTTDSRPAPLWTTKAVDLVRDVLQPDVQLGAYAYPNTKTSK